MIYLRPKFSLKHFLVRIADICVFSFIHIHLRAIGAKRKPDIHFFQLTLVACIKLELCPISFYTLRGMNDFKTWSPDSLVIVANVLCSVVGLNTSLSILRH